MILDSELSQVRDAPGDGRTLVISSRDWETLLGWARSTDQEVSGLGLLELRDGEIHISRVYLPPQRSNAIETQLEPDGLARLMMDLVAAGVDPRALRLWWHSHAREKPFWSSLDERTIQTFSPSAMVSLVIDHDGHRLARLDTFEPRMTNWLELVVVPHEGEGLIDASALRGQVAERVGALDGTGRLTYRAGH
jgi:hypothetical protein